ncbi:hypothetical protein [Polaribacter sp.]|uniref:hypothetical protein n=1 Tax=Polaribacter sp. TaxID=1920175 RepID=UPI003F6A7F8A
MANLNNSLKIGNITLQHKIRKLLEQPYKLVLVQKHELERLKNNAKRSNQSSYIEKLYKHYIIEGKPKTYLCKE